MNALLEHILTPTYQTNQTVNFCYHIGKWNNERSVRLFTFRKQKSNFWWLMLGVYIGFIYVIYRSTQLYGRFYYSSFVNKHKLKYLRLKLDVKIRNSLWEILILKLWIKKKPCWLHVKSLFCVPVHWEMCKYLEFWKQFLIRYE